MSMAIELGAGGKVAAYLAGLPHIRNVRPVRVRIEAQTFEGAYYEWEAIGADGSPAAREGRVKWRPRLYLLGEIPRCRQRRQSLCFTYKDQDWYMGGGHTPHLCRPFRSYGQGDPKYRPFGDFFDISLWSVPDGTAIDHCEPHHYVRVPMTVEG